MADEHDVIRALNVLVVVFLCLRLVIHGEESLKQKGHRHDLLLIAANVALFYYFHYFQKW